MKKVAAVLLVAAFAAIILQPVSLNVNSNSGNGALRADGGFPMPPFPTQTNLVADGGFPMPPFPSAESPVLPA